jgi:hypothetical protein
MKRGSKAGLLKSILFSMVTLLATPLVFADLSDTMARAFDNIVGIGNLGFLGLSHGSVVVGFTRVLIWTLIFTILFAVTSAFGFKSKNKSGALGFLSKSQGMVVAAIIATISAVYLPNQVLLATGAGMATIFGLLLVGGPVVAVGLLLFQLPGKDKEDDVMSIVLKLLIVLVLFWVLTVMRYHVAALGGGVI